MRRDVSLTLLCLTATAGAAPKTLRPMRGWNSWNSFTQWVDESWLLKQANYFVDSGMRELGWEYIVSDGGWYYPGQTKDIRAERIDEFGRLIPDPERYPRGWKALCDDIHNLGLKCGFHLFRGVPGRAWEERTPIKNSNFTVRDAGFDPTYIKGHGAFYEIDVTHPSAAAYLDSMFELYCSWGIDFIKLDGVGGPSRKNATSYTAVQLYREAIDKHCGGRDVVISLSAGGPGIPGWPSLPDANVDVEYAQRVASSVQMIRVTPDSWDIWDDNETTCPLAAKWAHQKAQTTSGPWANMTGHSGCCWGGRVVRHFEEFAVFANLTDVTGVFPDGDMLQMGRVGSYDSLAPEVLQNYASPLFTPQSCSERQLFGFDPDSFAPKGGQSYDPQVCPRQSYLTFEEQRTLVSLWSFARSPLMMGGELTMSPVEVVELLKNKAVLDVNDYARNSRQVSYDLHSGGIVWSAEVGTNLTNPKAIDTSQRYAALFNIAAKPQTVEAAFETLGLPVGTTCQALENLWSGGVVQEEVSGSVSATVPSHGAVLFKLTGCGTESLV